MLLSNEFQLPPLSAIALPVLVPSKTEHSIEQLLPSITSTEERAQMQVSASDNCERNHSLHSSMVAKGQNDEECLLRNVES